MADNDAEIVQELKRVTAGLLFMSESDYPFEVIHWEGLPNLTHDFLCRLTGESEDCQVEEMQVENFLLAERYRNIVQVLSKNLAESRAYKVGRINMPVYVVGKSKRGNWLGVATRVVQT
ncbi:MAG TPA: nuclease A inhibitor family protein [Pyrinomonadaceae bacterium]|nr:nuclease A inhibitor family protein [Pyrinomonadaceae bacterium]